MTDQTFGDAWRLERANDGTRTLWFDRPGSSQNSLDRGTLAELQAAVNSVATDANAGVLVIRSAKPKGFCAGADLKQMQASSSAVELHGFGHLGMDAFDAIENLSIPTVAVIHGTCLGGGLELALACRDRLAIEGGQAILGLPEVNLSLLPGWDGVARLPRLVGLANATDLLLSGRAVDSEEANRIGLIDAIVAQDGIAQEIDHLRKRTSQNESAPWPPQGWEEIIGSVRERVNTGPEEHKRAREILLDVLETDLMRGREAGREAAVIALATLAMAPEARAAIERFFNRPSKS